MATRVGDEEVQARQTEGGGMACKGKKTTRSLRPEALICWTCRRSECITWLILLDSGDAARAHLAVGKHVHALDRRRSRESWCLLSHGVVS